MKTPEEIAESIMECGYSEAGHRAIITNIATAIRDAEELERHKTTFYLHKKSVEYKDSGNDGDWVRHRALSNAAIEIRQEKHI